MRLSEPWREPGNFVIAGRESIIVRTRPGRDSRRMMTNIDPEILAARGAQAEAHPAFDVTRLPIAEGRRLANAAASFFNDDRPKMASIHDEAIGSAEQPVRVRVYRPANPRGHGAILYIHGGGWYACSVDTHDRLMRLLAEDSGLTVAGVDFRLAPEHPFPAALEDCIAAWDWLQGQSAESGIDPERVVVAGDSAGGNLALALTLWLRDERRRMPAGAAILYGCLAPGIITDTSTRFGQGGYGLTAERMEWYWRNYLGPAADAPPSLAAPLYAELDGLPPIFIGIAEADTIADESRMLLQRLQAVGVSAELKVWEGAVHGFLQMTRDVALARNATTDVARWAETATR